MNKEATDWLDDFINDYVFFPPLINHPYWLLSLKFEAIGYSRYNESVSYSELKKSIYFNMLIHSQACTSFEMSCKRF